ncbi:hypothetical protein D3C71_1782780 [compost metagenome]
MLRRLIKIVFAYNRKIATMATSRIEEVPMAAPPFTEPATSSMEGSNCRVTKEKYSATLKINAKTYR